MLEFALALPILLVVIYGLLETGRLLFIYASVVTAARQAARYGSATGDNGSGTKYYDDCGGILASARKLEFIQPFTTISVKFDNPQLGWHYDGCPVDYSDPANNGHMLNGDRIRVSVTARFSPIVPLVPLQPFDITSTSNRTLLVGSYISVEHPGEGFMGSGTQGFILTKWANAEYYYKVGDVITYHYAIQNTGTTPIDGPFYILDNKIPHPAELPGNLCTGAPNPLPGSSAVITCPDQTYTITAADITAPEVTNHARAQNATGSIYSNEAVWTVSFVPEPHITLAKVGTSPDVVDVGAKVTYAFTITNDGNVPLVPPYTINDSLLAHNATCPATPNPVPVGGTVTCSGEYSLKNADINAAFITNSASATAMYGTTTVTSATVTVDTPVPLLQLTLNANKTSTTYSAVGNTLTYTFDYWNRGTKQLTGLGLTSATLSPVSVNCPGSVPAGGKGSCTMTYVVQQPQMDAGTIIDSVTMHGTQSGPSKIWTSNAVSTSIQGTQVGQVTLAASASPAAPAPPATALTDKQPITFNFSFQNTGNITLKGPYTVKVDDLRFGGGTGTFICTGPATLAPLSAPFNCTPQIILLTQQDVDAGTLILHATGTALPNVGITPVTAGTATVTVVTYALPRVTLVKTPNRLTFVASGDQITYTYGLKNTGGTQALTVTPFVLTDNPLGAINCPAGTIAIGATMVCDTRNYVATDTDVANLVITNTLTYNSGTATGTSGAAPNPPQVRVDVPLLRCDSTTLTSSTITDGSSTTWTITNKTGTSLHITGGWMRWSNPVLLTQMTLGGQVVGASGASTLLLPFTGWPSPSLTYVVPNPLNPGANDTVMNLTFSGTASHIQIYLTFQEAFSGLTCTLSSPLSP